MYMRGRHESLTERAAHAPRGPSRQADAVLTACSTPVDSTRPIDCVLANPLKSEQRGTVQIATITRSPDSQRMLPFSPDSVRFHASFSVISSIDANCGAFIH